MAPLDVTKSDRIRDDYIPAAEYNAPDVTALENTRLWPKIWQVACRVEEIPNVGDFVNYEIVNESILVVRTKKDEIKAFYNVCQHRGRRLRDEDRGNVAQGFYCRFHGWRYALDGSVTYVHNEDDWKDCKGFKKSNLDLKQPQVGTWAGWVWINMDPDAEPLLDFLGEVVGRLKNFDLENARMAWYETIIAPVNWKVVVEAFNEGYHAGATHNAAINYNGMVSPTHLHGPHNMYFTSFSGLPTARREDGKWSETTSLQEMIYYQSLEINETLFCLVMEPLMKAVTRLYKETKPDMPPEQVFSTLWDWHKEEVEKAGLVWPPNLTPAELGNVGQGWQIFPNTIFQAVVDGTLWYRMRPYGEDPNKCVFDIWCLRPYAPGQEPKAKQHISDGFEVFRGRNPFLEQDFENMKAVDMGMKSRGWGGAVVNPRQEIQVSQFHRILHDYMYGNGNAGKNGAARKANGAKPVKKAVKAKAATSKAVKAKKPKPKVKAKGAKRAR